MSGNKDRLNACSCGRSYRRVDDLRDHIETGDHQERLTAARRARQARTREQRIRAAAGDGIDPPGWTRRG